MSQQFLRWAVEIVSANVTGKGFSSTQLAQMLREVAETLESLAVAPQAPPVEAAPPKAPEGPPSWKAAIGRNAITCLICGYQGKMLTPHLKSKHQMTPREYRREFQIPAKVPLVSKAYRATRSRIARETGVAEKLKGARQAKKA